MRYVSVFCHAFKEYPSRKRFRLAYKIIDPSAGKYASVYSSPIKSMASGISPNTPHCLAAILALKDPFFDKVHKNTIICLFNNHQIIHTNVQKYLVTGKLRDVTIPFDRYVNLLCKSIDTTRTATRWNNIKDPDNVLSNVLKDLDDFHSDGEISRSNVFCDNYILSAAEAAAHEMISEAYENFMRSRNSSSIFDESP